MCWCRQGRLRHAVRPTSVEHLSGYLLASVNSRTLRHALWQSQFHFALPLTMCWRIAHTSLQASQQQQHRQHTNVQATLQLAATASAGACWGIANSKSSAAWRVHEDGLEAFLHEALIQSQMEPCRTQHYCSTGTGELPTH